MENGRMENSLEREVYTSHVLDQVTEEEVLAISDVDKKIFPDMPVPLEELRGSLMSEGVQVILNNSNAEIVGYITSLPHNEALKVLKELDAQIEEEKNGLYIESIGILPEHRSLSNILSIWKSFKENAKGKNFQKVTAHVRSSQGLSEIFQKRLNAKLVRTIDNWADFGESFDYLELDL